METKYVTNLLGTVVMTAVYYPSLLISQLSVKVNLYYVDIMYITLLQLPSTFSFVITENMGFSSIT